MDKITEEISISGKTSKAVLAHNKIKVCLNISGIPVDYKVDKILSIADSYKRNEPDRFIEILEYIGEQVKAKHTPILIMCHAGVSRSPTIAALYLFYSHKFDSFDDALGYVISKSSIARPNPSLVDFIKKSVIPKLKK